MSFDPFKRLSSGLTAAEAVSRAREWWDRTGRHIIRNPEFRDPDVGFKSGILRGLPFDELERDEKLSVVKAWHEHKLKPALAGAPPPAPPRGSKRVFAG